MLCVHRLCNNLLTPEKVCAVGKLCMDKLRMINYSKRLDKTQNALKFRIPEHLLNWKRITMVNKSKTPFFPISPCKRYPLGIWKIGNAASVTGL